MLAVSQNAAALCAAWCDPAEMAALACRHDAPATSASVSGADHCGSSNAEFSAAGVDTRRMTPAPALLHGAAGQPFVHSLRGTDRAALAARGSPFHGASHLIALRI